MANHNRRNELIEEVGYCECDISSPSSHHDCCINKDCGKVIKTIYEKYRELEEKYEHLKDINYELGENLKAAEDQNHYFVLMGEYRDKLYDLQKQNEGEYDWNLYHDNQNRNYSDIKKIEQLEEYAKKMADPDNVFYISHTREYEVIELDGTKRMEKVHTIKNIQQMAKDARKALGKE